MRQPTLVRTAFRRISRKQATPRTPGPYDTITRYPTSTTPPGEPEPDLPDRYSHLGLDEIAVRRTLLVLRGEFGGAA